MKPLTNSIARGLLIIFIVAFQNLVAQPLLSDSGNQSDIVKKTIGFQEILDQLINSPDSVIVYEDEVINLWNFSLRKIDRLFSEAKIDSGLLIIDKSIEFHNCTIYGKGLTDLTIKRVLFNKCNTASISFTNIRANELEIYNSSIRSIRVLNSTFDKLNFYGIKNPVPGAGDISIFRSNISDQLRVSGNKDFDKINILTCDIKNFRLSRNTPLSIGMVNNHILNEALILEESAEKATLRKNKFLSSDSLRFTLDIDCDRLVFLENEVNVPVIFADSKFSTKVEMADNTFREPVDFHDVALPEFGKYIPFSQFEKGFVVYKNLYGEESPEGANCYYCELYTGESDEELADKTNFDKLVQSYEILFLGYKSTGDIESANLSYIQIKDLYLKRLGYIYRTDGGFKNYFRWRLAQLLKFYTNHGTDPALSILISIYVVLIFAVFYIFFPSEWDVTSKARLISDFKDFIDKNDKGRLKPFLALLAGFIISLLNAITLSLNSFVTLGFGTIPTTGAARYVCILQGFIGWFLLSIFTVSLINQILF